MQPYQTPSAEELRRLQTIAEAMAKSGDYRDIKSPEQAFNRILIGRDLGLSPAQAMMGVDLVRGDLMMRGVLLAAFVRKSEDYDYEVVKHDHTGCRLHFFRLNPERELLGESVFTVEDAAHARLIKPDSAWQTVPKSMVFWRAMSNGVKWYCPDLLGGMPVYTEADEFKDDPQPGDGQGDGSEPGWELDADLVAEVEAVIAQAREQEHAGLTDVASLQMTLNGQGRVQVLEWLETARAQLAQLSLTESERVSAREHEDST